MTNAPGHVIDGERALDGPEIGGYRDLWAAAPDDLRAAFGVADATVGGVHCAAVAAVPDHRVLNHVLGAPPSTGPADWTAIERYVGARGGSPPVALPEGHPAERLLAARGYRPDATWVKFVRNVVPVPEPACELRIGPVGPDDALGAGRLVAAGFELPPELGRWFAALVGRPGWHVLGAYDADHLVATGSLHVGADGGWLTWAATDPAHRGRRAQRALLRARVDLARRLGVRQVVVETGEPRPGTADASYRNLLWAGFRPAYRRRFWRAPARP